MQNKQSIEVRGCLQPDISNPDISPAISVLVLFLFLSLFVKTSFGSWL